MAVNTYNSDFSYAGEDWSICRDAVGGERQVKSKTTTYIPKLSEQDSDEYAAYLNRGAFYGATGRTVKALTGILFRKQMVKEGLSRDMQSFTDDVTGRNEDLQVFATSCVEEAWTVGRGGILVDYTDNTVGMTKAEADAVGSRPIMSLYKTEQIINWQQSHVLGRGFALSRIVLEEVYRYFDPADPYTEKVSIQYRDLYLDESGYYQQDLYRENGVSGDGSKGVDLPAETYIPLMNGKRIPFIPFVFFNTLDNKPNINTPPLLNLATLNIHHFKVDVDYAHALHYVGLPTPYIFGAAEYTEDNKKFSVGPGKFLSSSAADVNVGYLQVDSSGFSVLPSRQKQLSEEMAKVGARMLSPEISQAEATETLVIKNQGEYSVLACIAKSVSSALTTALQWCAMWMDEADYENILIKINTDFNPKRMDANELIAWTKAVQSGVVSYDTFFHNMKQGELIPDNRKDAEEEKDMIETDGTMFVGIDENRDSDLIMRNGVPTSQDDLETSDVDPVFEEDD